MSAVTDPPFEYIENHFAPAADGTIRDSTRSSLYPIPPTTASLQTPAQIPTASMNMQNSRIDSVSLSLITANNASGVGVSDIDVRKTSTQTTNPSNPTDYDPTMYNTGASRTISRKSLGATLGAVSGAGLMFAIIYLLRRFNHIYFVKVQARTRSDAFIEDESDSLESDSIYRQSEKEISRFSVDS